MFKFSGNLATPASRNSLTSGGLALNGVPAVASQPLAIIRDNSVDVMDGNSTSKGELNSASITSHSSKIALTYFRVAKCIHQMGTTEHSNTL